MNLLQFHKFYSTPARNMLLLDFVAFSHCVTYSMCRFWLNSISGQSNIVMIFCIIVFYWQSWISENVFSTLVIITKKQNQINNSISPQKTSKPNQSKPPPKTYAYLLGENNSCQFGLWMHNSALGSTWLAFLHLHSIPIVITERVWPCTESSTLNSFIRS